MLGWGKEGCLEICNSACCQDINIYLRPEELVMMTAAGAVLYEQREPNEYKMVGRCPFLGGDGKCTIYKAGRPEICERFKKLGQGCKNVRQMKPFSVKVYTAKELKTLSRIEVE